MQKPLALIAFLCVGSICFAQKSDSLRQDKTASHYFGVQTNLLLRQFLNFGGTSELTDNPYVLTWAVNSKKTGFGFTAGVGYVYKQQTTNDGFSSQLSTTNDLSLRFGLEGKRMITKRWMGSIGGDILITSKKDKTESNSNGGSSPISTTTKVSGTGFGPRVTINFFINSRIILGTEASCYYMSKKQTVTLIGTGQPTPQPETLGSLTLSVPSAVYFIFKI